MGASRRPRPLARVTANEPLSLSSLKQRLSETEARLRREREERAADADTIAAMLLRIVNLEKSLRAAAHDADRPSRLAELQLRAADAKLELVDRQLEWAEELVSTVQDGLQTIEAGDELKGTILTLLDRLASARSALSVDVLEDESLRPPRRSKSPPRA